MKNKHVVVFTNEFEIGLADKLLWYKRIKAGKTTNQ